MYSSLAKKCVYTEGNNTNMFITIHKLLMWLLDAREKPVTNSSCGWAEK